MRRFIESPADDRLTHRVGAADAGFPRLEAHGRVGNWSNYKNEKAQLLKDKKIIPLIEVGLEKTPEFPDVPLLANLARTADERAILEFMAASSAMGRVFVLPPDVPAEPVQAIRRAFDATMKDPLTGEQLQAIVARTMAIPPALLERARNAIK